MSQFTLTFIGVGAPKSGTTWLASCLGEHPQVCMSKPKELNYFCSQQLQPKIPVNRDKGESWLRARFSHWRWEQIRGEMSVCYLVDSQSPRLIQARFPNIKIIISYRNPTDSLYSLYYQAGREFSVPNTFEEFIKIRSDLLQVGYYYTHTRRYLDYFPLKNFHFILYDDICHNPEKVLVDLFRFLDIDTDYLPTNTHKRVNTRKAPRSILLRNIIGHTRDALNSRSQLLKIKRSLCLFGFDHMANWAYAANLFPANFHPMKKETRARLTEIYEKEISELGGLLKRDLNHWSSLSVQE